MPLSETSPHRRSPAGHGTGDGPGRPITDTERRAGLRRMRSVAVGLLGLAALLFVLTHDRDGWLGFVNAAAEAAMVGAIADWFAVTALFRHPLRLPIPHTALIPRRKDDLGRGLEEFVAANFLHEDAVRSRLASADVSGRASEWLADPQHRDRLVREGSALAATALRKVRDSHLDALVNDVLAPRLREEPIAPLLSSLLRSVLDDDVHHGLVDLALTELQGWLAANPETVMDVLGERAPWWAPERVNEAVTARIHVELVDWVADIRNDPHHRARRALDRMLAELAENLLTDPHTQRRAEALKERLLDRPQLLRFSSSLWEALRAALLASLEDPEGAVRRRAHEELGRLAEQLATDRGLRARLDALLADAVVHLVDRYGAEAAQVITQTIQQWDGDEAARRIELHVGRDLQFIRINGTLVGGLVGVAIHTVVVLL